MAEMQTEMTLSMVMPATAVSGAVASDTTAATGAYDTVTSQDDCVQCDLPAPTVSVNDYSIYAESITSSGAYDPADPMATFDIVFNVGIREGNTSKTYRIVKRISVNKMKIATEAASSEPAAVVESKGVTLDLKRLRHLAGV